MRHAVVRTGFLVTGLVVLILPAFVFAATPNTNIWNPSILKGPLVICSGAPVNVDSSGNVTSNPTACQSVCDIIQTAIEIIYFGMGFVIWILAPIFIGYSGILYLIAGPNPEMLSKANHALKMVGFGILIVACAWLLLNVLVTVLGITGIGGFGGAINCSPATPSSG